MYTYQNKNPYKGYCRGKFIIKEEVLLMVTSTNIVERNYTEEELLAAIRSQKSSGSK